MFFGFCSATKGQGTQWPCCVLNLASIKSFALRQGCAANRSLIQIPMEMRYSHAHGNKNERRVGTRGNQLISWVVLGVSQSVRLDAGTTVQRVGLESATRSCRQAGLICHGPSWHKALLCRGITGGPNSICRAALLCSPE